MVLNKCFVGRNCRVGDGAAVSESYLWDGVTVERGAVVTKSIVCNGAVIRAGARIDRSVGHTHVLLEGTWRLPGDCVINVYCVNVSFVSCVVSGCIISYGVIIDAGVHVPEFTRISLQKKGHVKVSDTSHLSTDPLALCC